jgi:hypothetical protein
MRAPNAFGLFGAMPVTPVVAVIIFLLMIRVLSLSVIGTLLPILKEY